GKTVRGLIPQKKKKKGQKKKNVSEEVTLRRKLLSSIEDIDKTDWIGESALVLINAEQHRLALDILQELHKKPLRTQLYDRMLGDKETFWLSIMLSGKKPQFNAHGLQIVGIENRTQRPKRKERPTQNNKDGEEKEKEEVEMEEEKKICTAGSDVIVQYRSEKGVFNEPNIFYLNGESIEKLLEVDNPFGTRFRANLQFISGPVVGNQQGTCRPVQQCKPFDGSTFDALVTVLAKYRHFMAQQLIQYHHPHAFGKHLFFEDVVF
ncbi:hypothetical protein RFI_34822, partial [Reticulomyxa filosa]